LPSILEKTSYTVGMVTWEELWRAVGEQLQRARLKRKLTPLDVERHGGPSYKTVQAIEDGEIGNVNNVDRVARALGLSAVDIIYAVLAAREVPLSPEAALIIRKFNETTVEGRSVLVQVANVIPSAPATVAAPSATKAESEHRPRPAHPGAKHRSAK